MTRSIGVIALALGIATILCCSSFANDPTKDVAPDATSETPAPANDATASDVSDASDAGDASPPFCPTPPGSCWDFELGAPVTNWTGIQVNDGGYLDLDDTIAVGGHSLR